MSDADDWLTLAMADTQLVAELLLTLRRLPSKRRSRPSPPQSWTIHQRRSRTQPLLPSASNKSEAPRASPSTPLSWSGATSISGGGGGGVPIVDVVDSTQPNLNHSVISRSKVTPPGETTPTKRPRKKKTLAALKEEEALLIEEQKHLKRKLETLQATCEKQIKDNESLKNMKCGYHELDIEVERQQRNKHFEAVNERKDKIVLPDLNDPAGEDVMMSY